MLIILAAIIGEYALQTSARLLNLKALNPALPGEFEGFYDATKYRRSQEYTQVKTTFSNLASPFNTALIIGFILFGGFNLVDTFARGYDLSPLSTGLLFFASLFVLSDLINTPSPSTVPSSSRRASASTEPPPKPTSSTS